MNKPIADESPELSITMNISFNPDDVETIIVREIGDTTKGLYVNVPPDVKAHTNLRHTTSIKSFSYIINDLTLRCSSLTSANLNDQREKERIDIEKYAPSRFISCFSHITHESILFWDMYGDKINKQNNIQLVFKNFANFFADAIHTDYFFLCGGKRAFFKTADGKAVINPPSNMRHETTGKPLSNSDFDTNNWLESLELIDVQYLPVDHEVFTQHYSSLANLHFGPDESYPAINTTQYHPHNLGRHKTETWNIEYESRILCGSFLQDFDKWPYIDLRLKEEIFRDLIIITNPWAEKNFIKEICDLVRNSPLTDDIKSSITIQRSNEEGKINL